MDDAHNDSTPDPDANNSGDRQNPRPKRPLSEISHLFLSSIRDQGQSDSSAPRPVRVPPGGKKPVEVPPSQRPEARPQTSIDMTPDEFARMFDLPSAATDSHRSPASLMDSAVKEPTRASMVAMVSSEPVGDRLYRARMIASNMVAHGVRMGVLLIDQGEVRAMRLEFGDVDSGVDCVEMIDERQMSEALLELDSDIDQWLMITGDIRAAESRDAIRLADEWVVVTCGDHDGVVSGYRTLKGLSELGKRRTRVAMTSRKSGEEIGYAKAEKIWAKLAGVGRQFLEWEVEFGGALESTPNVSATTVYHASARHDKAQLASGVQWRVLRNFMELEPRSGLSSAEAELMGLMDPMPGSNGHDASEQFVRVDQELMQEAVVEVPQAVVASEPMKRAKMPQTSQILVEERPVMQIVPKSDAMDEVIELPAGASVLSAVLGSGMGSGSNLVACPIDVPVMDENSDATAKVAIDRDRRLVLVASAGPGLSDLPSVTAGLKWLGENRKLIAMALPQMSIDTGAVPRLMLLVEHGERSAGALSPLLANAQVTIKSYRKLRWGSRTGLLLEAA